MRDSPSEKATINNVKSQKRINLPTEDSVISLLYSYLKLNFDVVHVTDNTRYANENVIKLVSSGPIALFSDYRLIKCSGKILYDVSQANDVSILSNLKTSVKKSDDSSMGFDRDCQKRRQKLTNSKNVKGKDHLRLLLIEFFAFAEQQKQPRMV